MVCRGSQWFAKVLNGLQRLSMVPSSFQKFATTRNRSQQFAAKRLKMLKNFKFLQISEKQLALLSAGLNKLINGCCGSEKRQRKRKDDSHSTSHGTLHSASYSTSNSTSYISTYSTLHSTLHSTPYSISHTTASTAATCLAVMVYKQRGDLNRLSCSSLAACQVAVCFPASKLPKVDFSRN